MKFARRAYRAKSLAEAVLPALEPLAAEYGLSQASLVTNWSEIVGEKLASVCEPIKLAWPPRGPNGDPAKRNDPATLTLRVAPGFSLEVQHLSPILIERVNAHFGWRCVHSIAIRQQSLLLTHPKERERLEITREAQARAESLAEEIEDPDLKNALIKLGAAVFSQPQSEDSSPKAADKK